jgi:hypothetical protein
LEVVVASFNGSLRTPKESDVPVGVLVDLSDERLRLSSAGIEIANWRLGEVRISVQPDGFHIHAAKELILNIKQEAEFAVALDLRSVPVGLARRMAVYRDSLR